MELNRLIISVSLSAAIGFSAITAGAAIIKSSYDSGSDSDAVDISDIANEIEQKKTVTENKSKIEEKIKEGESSLNNFNEAKNSAGDVNDTIKNDRADLQAKIDILNEKFTQYKNETQSILSEVKEDMAIASVKKLAGQMKPYVDSGEKVTAVDNAISECIAASDKLKADVGAYNAEQDAIKKRAAEENARKKAAQSSGSSKSSDSSSGSSSSGKSSGYSSGGGGGYSSRSSSGGGSGYSSRSSSGGSSSSGGESSSSSGGSSNAGSAESFGGSSSSGGGPTSRRGMQ